jgi:hypothetical protein
LKKCPKRSDKSDPWSLTFPIYISIFFLVISSLMTCWQHYMTRVMNNCQLSFSNILIYQFHLLMVSISSMSFNT